MLRNLLVSILFFCGVISAQRFHIENISPTFKQQAWNIGCGVPETFGDSFGVVRTPDGRAFDAAIIDHELFVRSDLKAGEKIRGAIYEKVVGKTLNFEMSDWILTNPFGLMPIFGVVDPGTGNEVYSYPLQLWDGISQPQPHGVVFLESFSPVRQRWYFQTRIVNPSITIKGWVDIFSNQDVVPFTIRMEYGTRTTGGFRTNLGAVKMYGDFKAKVDFAKGRGISQVSTFNATLNKWVTEVAAPTEWFRARTIESFGAFLCLPAANALGDFQTRPDWQKRVSNLQAREEAPVAALYADWDGKWLAFGVTPKRPLSHSTDVTNGYSTLLQRTNVLGSELAQRPYAQPPIAGTTGEQADFGASKCELAVVDGMNNPWAVYLYRYCAQAWNLRPYSNNEDSGIAVMAALHPGTKTYNLRPDERFSRADMLGWPIPVPYFQNWGTSDDQHRSDNLLLGTYALTRDPSLKRTIKNMIEMEKLSIPLREGTGVGSPRAAGRLLISHAHMVSVGFTEARQFLINRVNHIYNEASLRRIPKDPEHPIRVLSDREAKYGWNAPDGSPIRCWLPWQESIACMGLWAAHRQLNGTIEGERAKELVLEVATTISNYGFFQSTNGNWQCCYAVRWVEDNPGTPLPESAYNTNAPNYDVYVYGIQRWIIPTLMILAKERPDSPEGIRAQAIVDYYGPPANLFDAGWYAVTK